MKEFKKGDIVYEAGTNIKSIITDVRGQISRVKIKLLEGIDKDEELWIDSYNCRRYYSSGTN